MNLCNTYVGKSNFPYERLLELDTNKQSSAKNPNDCIVCLKKGIKRKTKHFCMTCDSYFCYFCMNAHDIFYKEEHNIILTGRRLTLNVGPAALRDFSAELVDVSNGPPERPECLSGSSMAFNETEGMRKTQRMLRTVETIANRDIDPAERATRARKHFHCVELPMKTVHIERAEVATCVERPDKLADSVNGVTVPSPSVKRQAQLVDTVQDSRIPGNAADGTGRAIASITGTSIDNEAQKNSKTLADLTIQTLNIKAENDIDIPWITGCCFMPEGELVLCDRLNKSIKLFDRALTFQDNFEFHCPPWDVAGLDDTHIVVTLPSHKKLECIQVLPKIRKGWTIPVDIGCYYVAVAGEQIFVTCRDDNAEHGKIIVYDIIGNLKMTLGVDLGGTGLFRFPNYIAVSESGFRMYVSDLGTDTVSCLTSDGQIMWRYKDRKLGPLQGVYVDENNDIFVCNFLNNRVDIVTDEGTKYKTLLSCRDGTFYPRCIAFRQDDKTLVIGSDFNDVIFVYKLS